MPAPRLLRPLDGPPFTLPALLDAVSERWWRLRPRVRAAIAAAVAVLFLAAGAGHVAASPWGSPVTVQVATRDLPVGHTIGPGDLRRASWPSRLVPAEALTDAAGTVVAPLPAGGVVTARHVAEDGLGGALPDDRAAVPLPRDLLPEVAVGSRVDLVRADLDGRGVVLAEDALVLSTDDTHVWVVVDRPTAAGAAAAAATGNVVAVVLPAE